MFIRHPENPLISPQGIAPSRPDFEVIGTFNAGATTLNGETLLLVRVAERPPNDDANFVLCPYIDENGAITLHTIRRDDGDYDTHDPRVIQNKRTGEIWLTSISHLRLARSSDGVHFTIESRPWLRGELPYESFGVEDARITIVEGRFYINYTAVSPLGIATALISTSDFASKERHGLIFAPANRDVAIFPEKIGGQYRCYHRPMPGGFGRLSIWIASSPDLLHWGDLRLVLESKPGDWEGGRVGGGAPPIKTDYGWLSIYHAADQQQRYCLGAFLTALDAPERLLAHSHRPIFEPDAPYEAHGFFGQVVFTCGAVAQGDTLRLYYGAADEHTALAEASIAEIVRSLDPV